MIRLRMLGASEIRIGRKVITPAAEVVFALGVYLCVRAGERLTREEVTETLWGEGRESQGRHSLRQMLYRLRQKGFTLDEDGEELYLDPARVESDLARALAEGWPATAVAADVDAAAQLAPGFNRVITERFDEWLDGVRGRLAAQHRRACLRQIARARREGRWADLDRWALQVLRSDPLNEEATLARAESAAISGSKAVALEIIDTYMEELGDRAPAIGLPASILRRRIAERRTDWSSRGPREVPLVGREELMARLTGYVDAAARGEGNSVLLWGAPGIGKTRLAEEVCNYAALRGFQIVSVRGSLTGRDRPLALLLSLVPQLLEMPGSLGCNPDSLAILTKVASSPSEPRKVDAIRSQQSLRATLIAALHDVMSAIATECRLLILTDDLHNADQASSDILRLVLCELDRMPVVHLGTRRGRPQHASNEQLHGMLIPPLTDQESVELSNALAGTRQTDAARTRSSRIAKAAGGNPLFVRELSLDGRNDDQLALPTTLQELMRERLLLMEPAQLRLLRLAAVLGSPLSTASRLAILCGPETLLSDQLESLDEMGLVRIGAQHSVELHECWQQAVFDGMRIVVRTALFHECASLLASEQPLSSAAAWRAANLFKNTGETAKALTLYNACAEEMLSRGLAPDALRILDEASDLPSSEDDRSALLLLRGRAERAAGAFAELVETCESAIPLVAKRDSAGQTRLATLVMLHTEGLVKTDKDFANGLDRLRSLVARESIDQRVRQAMCMYAVALSFTDFTSATADHFYRHSLAIRQQYGPTPEGALAELIYRAESGDIDGVLEAEALLETLEPETEPIELTCKALRLRAMAMRFIGRHADARELGERCFQLSREGALPEERASTCDAMIHAALDRDDLADAGYWMERLHSSRTGTEHPYRLHANAHTRARLCAHRGSFGEALDLFHLIAPNMAVDRMRRRKSVDLGLIAYSAAMLGEQDRALRAITELESCSAGDRASLQGDNYTEMFLRTLSRLGEETRRERVGVEYARRRRTEFPAPVAPYFESVAAFYAR